MPSSRIALHERPAGLLIQNTPHRPWLISTFLAAWLAYWLADLAKVLHSIGPISFCILGAVTLTMVHGWIWSLFGTETFLLTPESLVHTLACGPWNTTREYSVRHISNPHVTEHDELSHFSFGYGSEFHSIGQTLNAAEANQILSAYLKTYHPGKP